jgi:hypothetical protein
LYQNLGGLVVKVREVNIADKLIKTFLSIRSLCGWLAGGGGQRATKDLAKLTVREVDALTVKVELERIDWLG